MEKLPETIQIPTLPMLSYWKCLWLPILIVSMITPLVGLAVAMTYLNPTWWMIAISLCCFWWYSEMIEQLYGFFRTVQAINNLYRLCNSAVEVLVQHNGMD